MQQIWETIEQYQMLAEQDYVLVGVSGGPDSVALFSLLHQYAATHSIQLHIVHINHQLREEAAAETAYVEQLAAAAGVPCSVFVMPVKAYAAEHGYSIEQAGHLLRFACFQQVAQQYGATKLALGHHRGDRAESVLLHLLQGCGIDGLAALPPREGWLIRPLIAVNKEDLIHYCQTEQLVYFLDGSNSKLDCLRNRVRLQLLPQLEQQYNPNLTEGLLQLAELCQADQEYLRQQTTALWQQLGEQKNDQISLPVAVLRQQPLALQRRLLRYAYERLVGDTCNLSFSHGQAMLHLLQADAGEKKLSLPQAVTYIKSYDKIYFVQHRKVANEKSVASLQNYSYNWTLKEPFYLEEMDYLLTAHLEVDHRDDTTYGTVGFWEVLIDADMLPAVLTIRNRRSGDRVQPLGMTGHKKLKDFLIDRKISASQRDQLPLIVSAEEIIWIPGCFLAEHVRCTPETTQVYRLCCQKK